MRHQVKPTFILLTERFHINQIVSEIYSYFITSITCLPSSFYTVTSKKLRRARRDQECHSLRLFFYEYSDHIKSMTDLTNILPFFLSFQRCTHPHTQTRAEVTLSGLLYPFLITTRIYFRVFPPDLSLRLLKLLGDASLLSPPHTHSSWKSSGLLPLFLILT